MVGVVKPLLSLLCNNTVMDNEKELSPQQSLHLIQSMIAKTKGTVADSSFYYLLWGWLVFFACIAEFILKVYLLYPYHYIVWWLMPVGGIISGAYSAKQSKKSRTKTFVDEALGYIWISLSIAFVVLFIVVIISPFAWQYAFTYYILLYAIGTFISGKLMQFKPLVIGGLINFILAAVSVRFNFDQQLIMGAAAILSSYIIPGYLLQKKYGGKN